MNINKQRGAMIYTLIMALVIGSWILVRASMALEYQFQISKGKRVAVHIITIVDGWSKTMDYRCVISNSSTMTINDLSLSESDLKFLPMFDINFTAPPLPSIEFVLKNMSDIELAAVAAELKNNPASKTLAPLIEVTETNTIKVRATRHTGSAETGMIGRRSNGDAVITSVILGGISEFGINGC